MTKKSEISLMEDKFNKLQDEYYASVCKDNPNRDLTYTERNSLPESLIPEFTRELYRKSIAYEKLSARTKEMRKRGGNGYSSEQHADGFIDMRLNSDFGFQDNNHEWNKGQWSVFLCHSTGIFWKVRKGTTPYDIELDYWVDWVSDD